MSQITLGNVQIVLAGKFESIGMEDAEVALLCRGARLMKSVTKYTELLVAGTDAPPKFREKAEFHKTPVVDESGLKELMAGTSLSTLLSSKGSAVQLADLTGYHVVISGTFVGKSHAQLKVPLVSMGAQVSTRISAKTNLLILGTDPAMSAVEAQDSGVAFLNESGIAALFDGAPLSDFIGVRSSTHDIKTRIQDIVSACMEELLEIKTGEIWEDRLSVTLEPDGRIRIDLFHMYGTPLHEHVRLVLQRQSWPIPPKAVSVEVPLTFT